MDLVATHQRCLTAALMRTKGPVLELGVGWYSTTIIHEICEAQARGFLTVDNNEDWLRQFRPLQSRYHVLRLVGWWGELPKVIAEEFTDGPGESFGVCFVDNGQPAEREWAVRLILPQVEVFVFHDTEEGHAYGYDRMLGPLKARLKNEGGQGFFKYIWTDRCQAAWTTLASNTIDVSKWMLALPPVKKTDEVT